MDYAEDVGMIGLHPEGKVLRTLPNHSHTTLRKIPVVEVGVFLCYLHNDYQERNTGFEPVTSNLEGWRSTTELIPHDTIINYLSLIVKCSREDFNFHAF